MKTISSSPDRDDADCRAVKSGSCYVDPPPSVMEVMREQMEFLVAHVGPACHRSCAECARLEQVKRYLLRPFD